MAKDELIEAELTNSVIGVFYDVYNALEYGLREKFYMMAMERELKAHGHKVNREVTFPVVFKGEVLGTQRVDMIVDDRLVVEGKAREFLHRAATQQVRAYLGATKLKIGLLLHFGPEPRFFPVIRPDKRKRIPKIP